MKDKFLQDVMEAVEQGIVASKKVESNGFGALQSDIKGIHHRLDTLNGRIPKIEESLIKVDNRSMKNSRWIYGVTTAAGTATTLILIIISMAVWIFLGVKDSVEKLSDKVDTLSSMYVTRVTK